ncbi:tRNA pseudouridine(55) synthase TruB [Acidipila sp. EB88]|uniref:tRNA pseudouridine(55) synthase TruB n=1 Tax=Acidipila sp. EB88 TaxID=2305226 RepID=UPI000F5D7CC0|nr:tRNA pseudouridine(55) synthase TruB [Acidipila sp. EB88]RRA47152.1 tRNA pseudouridine(55) synthase TruB [Acidipila sp. EB88]
MNALLLVDKPGGMTSHDVVARVRRATGEKSVGHLGTLDPMATGLLPLLLGKWTRLAKFYGALAKTYTGVIRFGFATDTFDAEGQPAGTLVAPSVTLASMRAMAATFLGESEQMPPAYSAKKIGGKPAYAIARAGETPALRPARITVDEFVIESVEPLPDGTVDAIFLLRISAGGYVRSVAHAMGQQAGCGAHLAALRRVTAGPLRLEDAFTLAEIEARAAAGTLELKLCHPRLLLPQIPNVTADASTLERIRHGNAVALPEFSDAPVVKVFAGQQQLAAVVDRVAGVLFQPSIVLL